MEVQKPVKLIIVRHGHSQFNGDSNKKQYFQSAWNSRLTLKGEEQSHRVADFLLKHHGEEKLMIVSSNTYRAIETATILNMRLFEGNANVLGMLYDERIHERNISKKLDGKPIPKNLTEREIDDYVVKNKFGESMENVWVRVIRFANELKADPFKYHPETETLVVVSHYFATTAFVGLALSMDWDTAVEKLKFDNGSITMGAVYPGRIEIYPDKLNLTGHLHADGADTFAMPPKVREKSTERGAN